MNQPQPGRIMVGVGGFGGGGFGGYVMATDSPTLAFAPNGRVLFSATQDRTVRIWDVVSGKEIGKLKGHEGPVTALGMAANGKTLVTGSSDTTLLVWDVTGYRAAARPATQLQAQEIERVWDELAAPDAVKAFDGMQRLLADPRQAVAFLQKHLKVATPVDTTKLAKWISELDSKKFPVREQAMRELEKLGDLAVPALTRLLSAPPSVEARRRAEKILEKLTSLSLSPDELRIVRALEVLEKLDNAEAREVLTGLTKGAEGALPTREARAALARMGRSN
jgi:hypothetical protein